MVQPPFHPHQEACSSHKLFFRDNRKSKYNINDSHLNFLLNRTCFVESALTARLADGDANFGQKQNWRFFKDLVQLSPNSRIFKALKTDHVFKDVGVLQWHYLALNKLKKSQQIFPAWSSLQLWFPIQYYDILKPYDQHKQDKCKVEKVTYISRVGLIIQIRLEVQHFTSKY